MTTTQTTATVRASAVQVDDVVLIDGQELKVRHTMTTGSKAVTTTLAFWPSSIQPRHFAPSDQLTVLREVQEETLTMAIYTLPELGDRLTVKVLADLPDGKVHVSPIDHPEWDLKVPARRVTDRVEVPQHPTPF